MLFLLAIICPPLAVLVATGSPSRAAANCGLTLMFYFPGLFHALSVVDRHTTARRYDNVMRQMERVTA
jgi:uncharacterized membrane protein YqaE (UPF0057 family)